MLSVKNFCSRLFSLSAVSFCGVDGPATCSMRFLPLSFVGDAVTC